MTRAAAAILICLGVLLDVPRAIGSGIVASTDTITRLIEDAPEGSTIVVPPGVYSGNLRVQKAVILDGADAVTIEGAGTGTVVELLAPGITFRGFHVRKSGSRVEIEPAGIRAETGPVRIEGNTLEDVLFGIDLRSSSDSIVRDNRVIGMDLKPGRRGDGIRLWWSHRCRVEENHISRSRDMVFWYSEDLIIRKNRVEQSRYGLHFMYSHNTVLDSNTLRQNSVGIYLMYSNGITLVQNDLIGNRGPSGYGLGLKDCDDILARENRILANRVGIYADNTPSSINARGLIEGNLIAYNEVGMLITPNTKRNTIVSNGFIENEQQVAVHGRGKLEGNAFSSQGRGNFWSDYAGFDRDNDGIGDLPYQPASLFESLLAREPNLRLFVHSPAQHAIEFTARALPDVQPEPKLTDHAPLMSPPVFTHAPAPRTKRLAMLTASAALLAAGAATAMLASRPLTVGRGSGGTGR